MADMITIPESLRFWMNGRNRDSIQSVMKQKKGIPPNLEFEEVVAYHKARFAVDLMKHENYLFTADAWKSTWGAALAKHGENFYQIKSDAYVFANFQPGDWLSPDIAWNECFYCILKSRNGNEKLHIVTALEREDDGHLKISFSLADYDQADDFADTVPLGDGLFEEMDEHGFRSSTKTAVPDDSGRISVAELRNAAEAALGALHNTEILKTAERGGNAGEHAS